MKRLFLLSSILLLAVLTACKNEGKGEIQMVSPIQVYEAVYGEDSLQLLDVRTEDEYSVSHLKNAQNICVTSGDFRQKVAALDKQKPVYVYCKKGGRSAQAAAILKEMGFTKVYDLQGGITSWEQNGLETIN
ncbi:MAG: rhodanese-like domain-containing protein [Flavobacteriaceae bacterium]|nr:rhodanese-like domain-containing protein [Flavobacteriaceae bacterium]